MHEMGNRQGSQVSAYSSDNGAELACILLLWLNMRRKPASPCLRANAGLRVQRGLSPAYFQPGLTSLFHGMKMSMRASRHLSKKATMKVDKVIRPYQMCVGSNRPMIVNMR